MAYLPKPVADRFNQERAKFFTAPRKLYCPFCKIDGRGVHPYQLTADLTRLVCPSCGEGRPATDDDRRLYGGAA